MFHYKVFIVDFWFSVYISFWLSFFNHVRSPPVLLGGVVGTGIARKPPPDSDFTLGIQSKAVWSGISGRFGVIAWNPKFEGGDGARKSTFSCESSQMITGSLMVKGLGQLVVNTTSQICYQLTKSIRTYLTLTPIPNSTMCRRQFKPACWTEAGGFFWELLLGLWNPPGNITGTTGHHPNFFEQPSFNSIQFNDFFQKLCVCD